MGVTLSAMKIGEICFVEAGGVGLVPKILEAPDPVPGAIFCFCVSAGTNRRQEPALMRINVWIVLIVLIALFAVTRAGYATHLYR